MPQLRRYTWLVIFGLTVMGAIALLTLAARPGVLEDALSRPFFFFLLWIPLLAFWFVFLIVLGFRDLTRKRGPNNSLRWCLLSAIVMFATIGLLWSHVPQ